MVKDFLSDNSWILSLIAVSISFFSLIIVAIDKYINWKNQLKRRLLKKDLIVLKKIIELDVKDFHTVEIIKKNNKTERRTTPEYSKLRYIFLNINENEVKDKNIKNQIKIIKNLHPNKLFISYRTGNNFSLQFCLEIESLIKLIRIHLSQII